jgi:hypothetical protein
MACASAATTPASVAARASPLGLHDVAPATTSDAPVGASSIASGILQVDGAPFFPVGFYVHSLDKADWAWMETNGVNTVLTYTNGLKTEKTSSVTADDLAQMGEFLDAAAAHKIKVFFSLKDLYDTKNKGADNAGIVSTIVSAFKNHSALLGWYLNDEYKPDYIPQLEARYHNVSSLDPYHVSYSVEDTGKADTLKLYRNTSDLFGVDPYPWANATLTQDLHAEVEEINGLSAAFSGDETVGLCTVSQVFSWAAFDCSKEPAKCYDSWPPYEVMRAMSFLQPVLGSRGLIQYAYYAQFGYPGTMQPRTDPAVAARLLDLSRLSQQLRAFADHAFLRERTVLEVLDAPTTSDGIKLVHASHFADKGESDGAGVVVVVNGSSEPVHVSVVWNGAITKVKLEAWGVVSCGGRQCAPV